VITESLDMAQFFETAVAGASAEVTRQCANWIAGTLSASLNQSSLAVAQSKIGPQHLRGLIERIADGTITGKSAKEVFDAMWVGDVPFKPRDWPNPPARRQIPQPDIPPNLLLSTLAPLDIVDKIIEKRGLKQISDSGEIEKIIDGVLAANAQQVADYRSGKEKAFNSLVGQVMKASKGKANPAQVNALLKQKLSAR